MAPQMQIDHMSRPAGASLGSHSSREQDLVGINQDSDESENSMKTVPKSLKIGDEMFDIGANSVCHESEQFEFEFLLPDRRDTSV